MGGCEEDGHVDVGLSAASEAASWGGYDAAGPLNRVTFGWVAPLLQRGRQDAPLELEHADGLRSREDEPGPAGALLEREFVRRAAAGSRRPLLAALVSIHRGEVAAQLAWTLVENAQRVAMPVLLREFLAALLREDGSEAEAYRWAAALAAMGFFFCVCHHQLFWTAMRLGLRLRLSAVVALHRKALRLGSAAASGDAYARAVALSSTDVQRFDDALPYWNWLMGGPVELVAVVLLVWRELGVWAAIAGAGGLIALLPLQTVVTARITRQRRRTAAATDARVRLAGEAVTGALAVKLGGWADSFHARLEALRRTEANELRKIATIRACNQALFFASPAVLTFFTFLAYTQLDGGTLRLQSVFYVVALLRVPQLSCVNFALRACEAVPECLVTVERLERFLSLPEPPVWGGGDDEKVAVAFNGCGFGYEGAPTRSPALLAGLSLRIMPGELVAVVGTVGAGKSSLLLALLGELPPAEDAVAGTLPSIASGVAWCSQEPWLMSDTVRANVLFHEDPDETRYEAVLDACCLRPDLAALPGGDQCIVGERGVALSGGQRARVALARAAYSAAPVQLLDDPLSAVDAHVAQDLFADCICGVMKRSARILVTHQRQFVSRCDRVVVLDEGVPAVCGTYDEALEQLAGRPDLTALLVPEISQEGAASAGPAPAPVKVAAPEEVVATVPAAAGVDGGLAKEERAHGSIGLRTYLRLASQAGAAVSVVTLAAVVTGQLSVVAADVWLAWWASEDDDEQDEPRWLRTYAAIVVAVAALALLRALVWFRSFLRASTRLHGLLTASVLRAPLAFFHSNPSGRILNRLVKDQGTVDEQLPNVAFDALQCIGTVAAATAIVVVAVPAVLPAIAVLAALFLWLRRRFLMTSRQVKRLEALSRSPMYAAFGATLRGVATIRAFGAGEPHHAVFERLVDMSGAWYYNFIAIQRWLGLRLDAICAAAVGSTAFAAVAMRDHISAELVALALAHTLSLSGLLQWSVRISAETENNMVAVERIFEYVDQPGEREGTGEAPEKAGKGDLEFCGVVARYRPELAPTLKGLSFSVAGGTACGVVGRTGAGKSTILLALLRLVEVTDGAIKADGLDLANVPLRALRGGLVAVIPQEAVLFTGSWRENLDPAGSRADAELWDALDAARLRQHVAAGLDEAVGGLSAGERQLLCLARALLVAPAVLALDEATANVDRATDRRVQEALLEAAAKRRQTRLVIAHRLDTVLSCEHIVAVSNGVVAEQGAPATLLARNGEFRALADAAASSLEAAASA